MTPEYINKEISWLSFNERVLQEAANPDVPVIERLKFLGICSSNLDEFYRVRVATLRRLSVLGKRTRKLFPEDPDQVLKKIQDITKKQHHMFDEIFDEIFEELKKQNIYLIRELELTDSQGREVLRYFDSKVRPKLFPVMLSQVEKFPDLKDRIIYLAVELSCQDESIKPQYSIIEIPSIELPRFFILPQENENRYIIFLDDVIRYGLFKIFSNFNYDTFTAYTIKITRDAELDIVDDVSTSYITKVSKSLKKREEGVPVRFIHDSKMPAKFLKRLTKLIGIGPGDTIIAGSRYHNNRDLIQFPDLGGKSLFYPVITPLKHPNLLKQKSYFKSIAKQDILLHYPYQTFNYVIDLLREASIDPSVTSIKFTIYRVATNSSIMNALINAAKNGKDVVAVLELQARFDEQMNIYWANKLQEEGIKVIFGVPGLKVHSKLCLITRMEKSKEKMYAVIGTGNFNEDTAKIYSDHSLLTVDTRLTNEVFKIFDFFENNYKTFQFRHLILSPQQTRRKMIQMIKNEIANSKKGIPARIQLKLNNLVDNEMIDWLYRASRHGVTVQLNVRGMFSVVTESPELSKNIEAISIVDKFLEHTRIFVFENGGSPKYFISSADWMQRNFDHRVEVTCPIFDKSIKKELQDFLDIQWQDDQRSRMLNAKLDNSVYHSVSSQPTRAQWAIYEYLKSKQDNL